MQDKHLKQYESINLKIKALEKQKEFLKSQLIDAMTKNNTNVMESKNYLCTLEMQTREILDQKLVASYLGPVTFAQFKKPSVVTLLKVMPKRTVNYAQ